MVHIVEWENGTAIFPTEDEANRFQKDLPPGSSRWSKPAVRIACERPPKGGFSHCPGSDLDRGGRVFSIRP
jgi:hypothetical protein